MLIDDVMMVEVDVRVHECRSCCIRAAPCDVVYISSVAVLVENSTQYPLFLERIRGVVKKFSLETKLMHDPISFTTFRGSTSVKHKCLSHTHKTTVSLDCSIFPGGFPITGGRSPVCSVACCVFTVFLAVKVPFFPSHSRRF